MFYETAAGRSPVRDYVDSLSAEEAARLTYDLNLLEEFGLDLGMPDVGPVRDKLWAAAPRRPHPAPGPLCRGAWPAGSSQSMPSPRRRPRRQPARLASPSGASPTTRRGLGNEFAGVHRRARGSGFRVPRRPRALRPLLRVSPGAHRGAAYGRVDQAEAAVKLGTTQSAIARLESGTIMPTVETLCHLANVLGMQFEIAPQAGLVAVLYPRLDT